MNGVVGAPLSTLAVWTALVLAALLTGTLIPRWKSGARAASRRVEGLLLAAAAAGVVAWFAHVGALLGNSTSNELLAAFVPIDTTPGFRVAVLWATLPGACLTVAVIMLVVAALTTNAQQANRSRFLTVVSGVAMVSLVLAAWFAPPPNALATRIPPFVQSAPAALAPLFALLALVGLAFIVASAGAGGLPSKLLLVCTWVAATLAIAAEQLARSALGIGPRDAVLLGSASSGLALWLVTSAVLHRRVQSFLFRRRLAVETGRLAGARLAHAGAAILAISFALHALAARSTVAVAPGATVEMTDAFRRRWELANQGVSRFDAEGVIITSVTIESKDPGGQTRLLTPEIREHHGREGRHLENSVSLRKSTTGALQSMRIVLLEADSLDVASVRVTFLPVPILWPAGIILLLLSAAFAVAGERQPRPSRE
jgi:cytochrome c biogenesis factor